MTVNPQTTDGRPEGYHSITPFIVCTDATGAIAFYQEVFDAELISRNVGPDGAVMHAELRIGDSMLQLADPQPDHGLAAPDPQAVSASLALYVADVDDTYARAVRAGATVREEPDTFVTGDRFASVIDPYGRRWAIMTRVEEVSRTEAERRVQEWVWAQSRTR